MTGTALQSEGGSVMRFRLRGLVVARCGVHVTALQFIQSCFRVPQTCGWGADRGFRATTGRRKCFAEFPQPRRPRCQLHPDAFSLQAQPRSVRQENTLPVPAADGFRRDRFPVASECSELCAASAIPIRSSFVVVMCFHACCWCCRHCGRSLLGGASPERPSRLIR